MHQFFFGRPPVRAPLPPELTSAANFLSYLNISTRELSKIQWFRGRMYKSFELSKGTDKTRQIDAPNERLKYLQHKILVLLKQLYRVRNPVHGFVEGKSVRTNAFAHLRKRFVLNIDLQNFFPSITENRVIGVLKSLEVDGHVAEIIAKICCLNGCLPQGAPTSPILSNMICFRLDKNLLKFSKDVRCIYTRYADDLTFSSQQPMSGLFETTIPSAGHFSPELLASELRDIFTSNGFVINDDKAHYADRNSRRTVTGIKVNELLNVDRRYVRNIRAALYSIETLGEKEAQAKFEKKHYGNGDISAYLRGKISWLKFIRGQSDPIVRALTLRFNESFPEQKIELHPTEQEIRERAVWVVEYMVSIDEMAQGSAFFLKEVGLVTAAHCVGKMNEVDLYNPSKPSNKFKVSVVDRCEHRDLALLQHNVPTTEFFEFEHTRSVVEVGEAVTALGYPGYGPGDKLNVRPGAVSSLPTKRAVKMIEVTQKLSQGMSGGPLLDNDNHLVGVVHKGGSNEQRDFSIHIDVLYSWINSLKN